MYMYQFGSEYYRLVGLLIVGTHTHVVAQCAN